MRRLGLGVGISRRAGSRNGPALDLNFLTGALDSRITFARASTATRFNASGVLETVASGAPRFDHDPATREAKGLLLEEARTNLTLWSEDLSNVAWSKTRSGVTANAVTSPDGTLTADKLVEQTDVATTRNVGQGISFTSGTTYVWSVYVKAAERTAINMRFASGFAAGNTTFDLTAVTATNGGTVAASSITAVGNGWYRCVFSQVATSTVSAAAQVFLSSGGITYDGVAGSGVYLWGAQVEAGTFATSYIPTTTVAVARAVDICHVLTSAFPFNAAAGTVFAEFTPLGISGLQTIVYLDDTTNNERMGIRSSAGINAMLAVDGGATQVNSSIGTVVAGTTYKAAMSYVLNDVAGCQAGGTVVVDATATLPTVTRFLVGSRLSGSEVMSGHYKRAMYWPRDLDNADLQARTV